MSVVINSKFVIAFVILTSLRSCYSSESYQPIV